MNRVPFWSMIIVAIFASLGAAFVSYKLNERPLYEVVVEDSAKNVVLGTGSEPRFADADFFTQVKNGFIEKSASFIEVDLSSMKIRLFKEGKVFHEAPVVAKGREGSWWETPAGIYEVEMKEKSHFSSIGKVYQPWSIQFQGNFFIHGIPYYPSGEKVASSFSGGCVRIADIDAEKVYAFATGGMPVLVHEADFAADSFAYAELPEITAEGILAADLKNNFIFFEKNSREVMPIASITKLMTALVAAEYINLDKVITILDTDLATTSKPRLKAGQEISAYQLLFPLMLESSNEAGTAIARMLGKDRYVSLMNDKAKSLRMMDTHFKDSSGISEGNIATAHDLFLLAKYLLNNRKFILNLSSGELQRSAYGSSIYKDLGNFNKLPEDTNFIGGKIGKTTAAGETMLYITELTIEGEKRPVAIIVLQSQDALADVRNSILFIKTRYEAR